MYTAVGLYDIAHSANGEREAIIFKRLLHLAASKRAQVASVAVGRAVRLGGGDLSEESRHLFRRNALELLLYLLELFQCFFSGARDVRLNKHRHLAGQLIRLVLIPVLTLTSFHELGRRLPECLMRMCDA